MKVIAYILIPLVKANLWLRHFGVLEDKWFWADRFCSRQGITVTTRIMQRIFREAREQTERDYPYRKLKAKS